MCADIATRYSPRLAIDDRDDILAIWAAANIPTVKIDRVGCPSPVTWAGDAADDRLGTVVERVRTGAGLDPCTR